MRILPLAIALLTSAAAAQVQGEVSLWAGTTQFTSRGSLGSGTGEILQGWHTSHWRGIGDDGTQCTITGVRNALLQDQNGVTQESYHWSFRTGTDITGPLTGTGPQTRVGPFNLPTNAGGAVAFNVADAFTTPVVVPCAGHFSSGLELGPSPNWTADGISMHMSAGDGGNMQTVQFARIGAPGHSWQIIGAAPTAVATASPRTWRHSLTTSTPTLQFGNGGANYGMGGMFPEIGAPLSARVRGGSSMSGATSNLFLLVNGIALPSGVQVFPGGRLWQSFAFIVPLGTATANSAGEATHNILPSTPAGIFPATPAVAIMAPTSGPAMMTNHHFIQGL